MKAMEKFAQISTNVKKSLTIATATLNVSILTVPSCVFVTKDLLEMESNVLVKIMYY